MRRPSLVNFPVDRTMNPQLAEDDDWLEALKASDPDAYLRLDRLLRVELEAAAGRWLHPRLRPAKGSGDLVQDTFLSFFRRMAKRESFMLRLRDRDGLRATLFTILRRKVINANRDFSAGKRGKGKVRSESELDGVQGRNVLEGVVDEEGLRQSVQALAREVFEYLGELRPEYQEFMNLLYVENLPRKEIARRLGVSERGLRRWRAEIEHRLRERFP